MNQSHHKFAFLLAGVLVSTANVAFANGGGTTGYSGRFPSEGTCSKSGCHAPGAAVPTISLAGPTSLAAGATGNYTLTITTGAGRVGFNIDAADSANLLAVVAPGKIALNTAATGAGVTFGEVHHTGPNAPKVVNFSMTAPAAGVTGIRIYAAGMASNNSGTGGDGVSNTSYNVTVTGGGTPPVDAGTPDTGTPGSDAGVKTDGGVTPPGDSGTPGSDAATGTRDSGTGGTPGTDSGSGSNPGGGGVGEEEEETLTSSDSGCSAAPSQDATSSYAGTLMAAIGALVFSFGRRKRK